MKKIIFAMLLSLFALPVMAYCELDRTGKGELTDIQVQELKMQCEKMKLEAMKEPVVIPSPVPKVDKETISAWGHVAKEFSGALGVAAQQVGVGINEFLKTPAGILTAIIVVMMTIGSTLLAIFVGLMFTAIVLKLNQRFWFDRMEKVEKQGFRKAYTVEVKRYKNWSQMNDSAIGWSITSIILLAIYWGILVGISS